MLRSSLAAVPTDAKQITGSLFTLLEDAFRFIRLHLQTAHIIRGIKPEVYPEIAKVALRELLVNALVHRDYTIAAPVCIMIFDDRLEYHTPGRLPNSVTIESILLGAAHVLRNPIMYTIFSRAKLVTHFGSGVLRAKESIESNSTAQLKLAEVENEFIVTVSRPTTEK